MVVKRTDVYFSRRDQYPLWYPRVLNNESALLFVESNPCKSYYASHNVQNI